MNVIMGFLEPVLAILVLSVMAIITVGSMWETSPWYRIAACL